MDGVCPTILDIDGVGAVDARAIVAVKDPHGGMTVYHRGRLIRYLMAGEWYAALPVSSGRGRNSTPSAVKVSTERVCSDSVDAAEVLDYDDLL